MLEIYVIAYNNLFCVEYQIKTFKAFCKDNYKIIIVDSNCGDHTENSERKIGKRSTDDDYSLPKPLITKNVFNIII